MYLFSDPDTAPFYLGVSRRKKFKPHLASLGPFRVGSIKCCIHHKNWLIIETSWLELVRYFLVLSECWYFPRLQRVLSPVFTCCRVICYPPAPLDNPTRILTSRPGGSQIGDRRLGVRKSEYWMTHWSYANDMLAVSEDVEISPGIKASHPSLVPSHLVFPINPHSSPYAKDNCLFWSGFKHLLPTTRHFSYWLLCLCTVTMAWYCTVLYCTVL